MNGRLIKKSAFKFPVNSREEDLGKYAAVSLANAHCSIKANFGKKSFKFGIEDMLSGHYKELFEEIDEITIDPKISFDLIHEYLIHSGFVGTLQAFEEESAFKPEQKKEEETKDEFAALKNPSSNEKQRKKTLGPENLKFNNKNLSTSNREENGEEPVSLNQSEKGEITMKETEIENPPIGSKCRIEESKEHPKGT